MGAHSSMNYTMVNMWLTGYRLSARYIYIERRRKVDFSSLHGYQKVIKLFLKNEDRLICDMLIHKHTNLKGVSEILPQVF